MARIYSDMKLGFYPTSNKTIQTILSKFFVAEKEGEDTLICDPCCGEGEILRVAKEYFEKSVTYGVELDTERSKSAIEKVDVFSNSDALTFKKSRFLFDLMLLNPPYGETRDILEKITRLETRFVESWRDSVRVGGYMLLIITKSSIEDGRIQQRLYEKGYEVISVFYDEDNKDYQNFSQYFVLLKRTSEGETNSRQEDIYHFAEKFKLSHAIELKQIDTQRLGFPTSPRNSQIIFTPMEGLKGWQLKNMFAKKDKKLFQSKITLSLTKQQSTSIESPNEGQAIILLMAGLVDEKIAGRYLVKGECKKQNISSYTGEESVCTDIYYGEMYIYDSVTKKYSLLQ